MNAHDSVHRAVELRAPDVHDARAYFKRQLARLAGDGDVVRGPAVHFARRERAHFRARLGEVRQLDHLGLAGPQHAADRAHVKNLLGRRRRPSGDHRFLSFAFAAAVPALGARDAPRRHRARRGFRGDEGQIASFGAHHRRTDVVVVVLNTVVRVVVRDVEDPLVLRGHVPVVAQGDEPPLGGVVEYGAERRLGDVEREVGEPNLRAQKHLVHDRHVHVLDAKRGSDFVRYAVAAVLGVETHERGAGFVVLQRPHVFVHRERRVASQRERHRRPAGVPER